jgi:LmbE family N-acetylglucosaminyl deacetylase
MTTLVSFHAHPDDESVLCGGSLAQAARAGHRVVVITATDGGRGDICEGVLAPGESLVARRAHELRVAAELLGVERLVQLGHADSGMRNTASNGHAGSFWTADVERAARTVAAVLLEEAAEVLTIYDEHGAYGHPDHIQVHRVGRRAAALAGTPYVFEATLNRDRFLAAIDASTAGAPPVDGLDETVGLPESELTTRMDVEDVVELKRAAIAAHASQYGPEHLFRASPPEEFSRRFGTEWFRQVPVPGSPLRRRLLGDQSPPTAR